jgi:hypothetical protein
MSNSYFTAIQAVPQREDNFKLLKEQTGGTVFIQPPFLHCDDHYIRLLESVTNEDYLVRLEDDAVLAPDYQTVLEWVLDEMRAMDYSVTMLFATFPEIQCPDSGHEIKAIRSAFVCSGVALVYDSRIIKPFVEFYKQGPCPTPVHKYGPPDATLGMYLQQENLKLGVLTPSIVQHQEGPSFLGHGWKGARQSHTFRARYGELK